MLNTLEALSELTFLLDKTDNIYSRLIHTMGENPDKVRIFYMLYFRGELTQKEIIEINGMPKQSVSNIILKMQSSNQIKLISNPSDKRSKLIELTQEGREYAAVLLRPIIESEQKVLQKMGKDGVEEYVRYTRLYASFLEEELKIQEKKNEDTVI